MTKENKSSHKKRQWGTEKSTTPLPTLHEKPSVLKIALGNCHCPNHFILDNLFDFYYFAAIY